MIFFFFFRNSDVRKVGVILHRYELKLKRASDFFSYKLLKPNFIEIRSVVSEMKYAVNGRADTFYLSRTHSMLVPTGTLWTT
jgi:hypothetical protein